MILSVLAMIAAPPAAPVFPGQVAVPPPVTVTRPLLARADAHAIMDAMAASAAGWNAGDIDRFLAVYDPGPDTIFVGSSGVQRGVAAIRARYLKSYPRQFGGGDAGGRSRLSFETTDLRAAGAGHALLVARYTLTPAGGGASQSGPTSLLFRRTPAGWRIVADHSS